MSANTDRFRVFMLRTIGMVMACLATLQLAGIGQAQAQTRPAEVRQFEAIGRVVDAETGKGINRAVVDVRPLHRLDGLPFVIGAMTDQAGWFRFSAAVGVEYRLDMSPSIETPVVGEARFCAKTAEDFETPVVIQAKPATKAEGRIVVAGTDQGVANAIVSCYGIKSNGFEGLLWDVYTDDHGNFRFVALPRDGEYRFIAPQSRKYQQAEVKAWAPSTQPIRIEVTPHPPRIEILLVHGEGPDEKVFELTGLGPVVPVVFKRGSKYDHAVVEHGRGSFRQLPPGEYEFRLPDLEAQGLYLVNAKFTIAADTKQVKFQVAGLSPTPVVVRDRQTQEGLDAVEVILGRVDGAGGQSRLKTDKVGKASAMLLPGKYRVHVQHSGYLGLRKDLELAKVGEPLVLDLDKGLTLTCRVTGKDGKPLANVPVEVWMGEPHNHHSQTDANGQARLGPLPQGPGVLGVRAEGWPPQARRVDLKDDAALDAALQEGVAVELDVTVDEGLAAELAKEHKDKAGLLVIDVPTGMLLQPVPLQASGVYQVRLIPGAYRLAMLKGSGFFDVSEIVVKSAGRYPVKVGRPEKLNDVRLLLERLWFQTVPR